MIYLLLVGICSECGAECWRKSKRIASSLGLERVFLAFAFSACSTYTLIATAELTLSKLTDMMWLNKERLRLFFQEEVELSAELVEFSISVCAESGVTRAGGIAHSEDNEERFFTS